MKITRSVRVAVAAVAAAGLVAGAFSTPSTAATRSTVVIVTSNALTGLNTSVAGYNLTFNGEVGYLTGAGFNYYDNSPKVVANKVFGNYKITKNEADDFRTTWTVNKGRVWSDGTPIDGVDLLLGHITASNAYSKAAGLGDPADKNDKPAFDSLGYSGLYDETIVGEPILSKDKMGVTLRFKYPIPNWDVYGPGPAPVHTLVRLAEGKKKLGTLKENLAAKAKFLKAFQTKDTAFLKKIGQVWSTAYNIKEINASTNPLLLVSNGGYIIKSAVPNQSVTLTVNPKYNSGPKLNGIKTIVFRILGDGTAAVQALANREVDVYVGQATADAVFQLKALVGVKVLGYDTALYEHVDFRHGTTLGNDDKYTGELAGTNTAKGRDIRTAVALAWPRQEIVDKLVKTIQPSSILMNSLTQFPKEPGYAKMVANSGVSEFSEGTQAQRTAKALALVKKYYPNASATNPGFSIKVLWGTPSNARRAAEAQLVIAELAKAGIKVEAPGVANWSTLLDSAAYDVAFFAWGKTAIVQDSPCGQFETEGGNNLLGYSNATIDAACKRLTKALPDDKVLDEYLTIEKELMKDVVSLPIFQHPGIAAVRAELKNIKPSPLSPVIQWNYWEWKY